MRDVWNMQDVKVRGRTPLSAMGLLVLCACASTAQTTGSRTQASGTSPESVTPATATASLPRDWHTLSHEERKEHMRDAVLPTMEPLFLAHDGDRFASFGCKTCHGPTARERDYAMPCPDLPTLYPTGSKEQMETVEQHREMATFMFQKVTPTMRNLLHLPAYDEATGEGFSCFYCHPRGEPGG